MHFLEEDHVVPLARGGPHEPWNVVRACFLCNQDKSDKLPSEWRPHHEMVCQEFPVEATDAIERRVKVIFPRMRHGYLLGDDNTGQAYGRIRALCSNFVNALHEETSGLPRGDKCRGRAITAQRSVEKLLRFVNDRIQIAEAHGEESIEDRSRRDYIKKLGKQRIKGMIQPPWPYDKDGRLLPEFKEPELDEKKEFRAKSHAWFTRNGVS